MFHKKIPCLGKFDVLEIGMLLATFDKQVYMPDTDKWFQKQKDMLTELVDTYASSKRIVRFSVGVYGSSADVLIKFNSGNDANSTKFHIEKLENFKGKSTAKDALKLAAGSMFTASYGSAEKSKKIMVLFVDEELEKDNDLSNELNILTEKNVKIIVIVFGKLSSFDGIGDIVGTNGKMIWVEDLQSKTNLPTDINNILNSGIVLI